MLFNSQEFMFMFLPIVFFVYFFLLQKRLITAAKSFLVFSSLFFYSWWNISYLPLILMSMLFNYTLGSSLNLTDKKTKISKKSLLIFGILTNLLLLGYFKYADFFIANINTVFSTDFNLLHLLLPLAISFFTFQQIAYLIDSYRKETAEYDFLNYALFVTFFPQLIAGPIVHHKEMMPQFANKWNLVKNYKNIALGIFIFSMGLFKKVIIADKFAIWATKGFDHLETLTLVEGWVTSLSYTFQLYFDFSGYTDMAIGAALLFNIKLPINFDSPYKSLSIQDFWRRWHITLSRFLKDYIYIPLGGSRVSSLKIYRNLITTFLLGGLWHGAGWTFIFWGLLHGVALSIHRVWNNLGFKMNSILAWFITFNFINISWVFFRAKEWSDAIKVLKAMFGMSGIEVSTKFGAKFPFLSEYGVVFGKWVSHINDSKSLTWTIVGIFFVLIFKNSTQYRDLFKANKYYYFFTLTMLLYASSKMNHLSEFLYFNF